MIIKYLDPSSNFKGQEASFEGWSLRILGAKPFYRCIDQDVTFRVWGSTGVPE